MNKQQAPAIASILFNPFTVAEIDLDRPQTSTESFLEEEQDLNRICYIRTKRSTRARRAMFDND